MTQKIYILFFLLITIISCNKSGKNNMVSNQTKINKNKDSLNFFNKARHKDISRDTNYILINNSGNKVYLLFENEGLSHIENKSDNNKPVIYFGERLYGKLSVSIKDTMLIIMSSIIISPTWTQLDSNLLKFQNIDRKEKKIIYFNIPQTIDKKSELKNFKIVIAGTKVYKFSNYQISIVNNGLTCMDTGINDVIVSSKKGEIKFKKTYNLKFFEYDIDKDGYKELYLCSFRSCESVLKVFKII